MGYEKNLDRPVEIVWVLLLRPDGGFSFVFLLEKRNQTISFSCISGPPIWITIETQTLVVVSIIWVMLYSSSSSSPVYFRLQKRHCMRHIYSGSLSAGLAAFFPIGKCALADKSGGKILFNGAWNAHQHNTTAVIYTSARLQVNIPFASIDSIYIPTVYKQRERNGLRISIGRMMVPCMGKTTTDISFAISNMRNVCAQRWASIRDWQIMARATFNTRRKCWASRDTNKDRRSINARTGSKMQMGRWHTRYIVLERENKCWDCCCCCQNIDHRSELLFISFLFFLNRPLRHNGHGQFIF